jgi:DHA1 family bicyclomycin/chloramphenicol resistance-like MFS transporter
MLLFARFVQGFGACAGPAIARAIIRDLYTGTTAARAMSVIGMSIAIAPAAGQVFGGILAEVADWRWIFVILGVFGVIILILSRRRFQETNIRLNPAATRVATMIANYAMLLNSRQYLSYVFAVSCCVGGLFAYTASAPFVLISIVGISATDFGLLGLFPVAGTFLGTLTVNRLAHCVGVVRLVWIGVMSSAIAGIAQFFLLTGGAVGVPTVVGCITVWMFGFGLIMPGAMAGALGPHPRIAGSASALMGFLQMGMGAIGTVLAAALNDGEVLSLAVAPALMGILGLGLFATLHRKGSDIDR